jgi:hypothetical protein
MSTQHPITPPPELVLALRDSAPHALRRTAATRETWLITHAYQVGADIQLDVVLAKLKQLNLHSCYADALRDLCRSEAPNDVINPPVRYVLHPGYVTSASDGQEHFIDGPRLARLHGLNILNRNVVFGDKPGLRDLPGDIHLRPRFDGDYSVFTPEAPNDVINLPVLATHSTPQPPADGEVGVLVGRLKELAHATTKENWREFDMRLPAEPLRDADLVLTRAADLLERQLPFNALPTPTPEAPNV